MFKYNFLWIYIIEKIDFRTPTIIDDNATMGLLRLGDWVMQVEERYYFIYQENLPHFAFLP